MATKNQSNTKESQKESQKESPMDFRNFFLYRLVGAFTEPKKRITRNSVFVKID